MPADTGGTDLTTNPLSPRPDPVYASSRLARLIRRATSWLCALEGDLADDRCRAGFAALEASELARVPSDASVRSHGQGAVLQPWDVRGPPERPPPTAAPARGDIGERCRGPPTRGEINNLFHVRSTSLETNDVCYTSPAQQSA